jgi:amidase
MDSYHRWMEVVAPAVSVPAGFNEAGLPMGLQIIAAPRRDADLLAVAALYEKLCPLARPSHRRARSKSLCRQEVRQVM